MKFSVLFLRSAPEVVQTWGFNQCPLSTTYSFVGTFPYAILVWNGARAHGSATSYTGVRTQISTQNCTATSLFGRTVADLQCWSNLEVWMITNINSSSSFTVSEPNYISYMQSGVLLGF